jgi:hypothetical protein
MERPKELTNKREKSSPTVQFCKRNPNFRGGEKKLFSNDPLAASSQNYTIDLLTLVT